jgi:hypothetical protein
VLRIGQAKLTLFFGIAMDEDQDFEAFLREWAKERIWQT